MMQRIHRIESIADFEVKDNLGIAMRGDMLSRSLFVFTHSFQQDITLLDSTILSSIMVFGTKLWAYSKGKTFEFEINDYFSLSNTFIDFYPKSMKGNLLIGDYKKGEVRFLESHNIVNGHKVWQLDFTSTIYKIDDQIYLVKFSENLERSKVYSFELESGVFSWAYSIPENSYNWYNLGSVYISERSVPIKAEIKKILGTFNEVLWISLNSGRLLGLDIHTGDLRHDLAIPANFFVHISGYVNQFDSAAGSLLDEKRGLIFGLHLTYYWEINLINPENEYILYDISEQCKNKLIGGGEITYELVWKDEEIIFHQWSFAQDPSYVGIFNRNTRQITWTSRELGEEGVFKGVKKVEFSENRLYVLDRANTLHIFER